VIENQLLIREVHHRVKNNMQVITSILRLQINTLTDIEAINALKDSISRIRSMGLIHNYLYEGTQLASINLNKYINDLTAHIKQLFSSKGCDIIIDNNVSDIMVHMDSAVPLGLILNELITNSVKHTAISVNCCTIHINLVDDDTGEYYVLTYSDEGPDLSKNFKLDMTKSLGIRLIHILVSQLNGTINLNTNGGLKYIIKIKK